MTTRLADDAWPDVAEGGTVLVPLGSTEQHGPHLPLSTDTVIAAAVADRVAAVLPGTVRVAPAVPYGASGEHAGFPGTVSIGHEALHTLLVEQVRSLALWAARVVFVNGHGGNTAALGGAVRQLRDEGHDTAGLACEAPGGDAHAGRTETSLMLHLAPEQVRLPRAAPGERRPIAAILPELRAHGVRFVAPNGVLGDPGGATADEGRRILGAMAADAVRRITAWRVGPHGRLLP
ncbi:mycofactocin biosynthesis peptidyl-dipeptidase MftE [Yinghuangia sp. ASG 101]|uniref:mycofactocin biosynthesis peptidyl-dipeptidase MftE n=1 Tax=Yinghuangia sp. ASG 101 TaxID=2896848 RepID=UPI001E3C8309|nr:mycofactocin biosynthesis peptidyl-dipeptidase MftE [Yinghuangia sp. ASG 101]UGQ12656.1 mycofactocin biosynthesis peptidyl-dipeptidase MftE [Yinghuangia sp. ASG 101]